MSVSVRSSLSVEAGMSGEMDPDQSDDKKSYSKDFLLKFKPLNTDKPDDLPTMDELLRGNSAPLERAPPGGGRGDGTPA